MDLLARHHERKRRLEPAELIEQGNRVAVRLGVTDPAWSGPVEVFKVFTFRDEDDRVVLMQDCIDRESALAELAR